MTDEEYKNMSVKEFTKAAKNYESDHAGIYKMCKKDYPDILEELEKEEPEHFAVRQYKKYKLAAGDICSK